jgi:redox-sensitive bicupin YhaK (pirin superfamily)
MRILLAEDNPTHRHVAWPFLNAHFPADGPVLEVADGAAVLQQQALTARPGLVIVSMDLPGGHSVQDVRLSVGTPAAGEEITPRLGDDRYAWVQVVRGAVMLNDAPLTAGDGAAVSHEAVLQVRAIDAAKLFLFDLA